MNNGYIKIVPKSMVILFKILNNTREYVMKIMRFCVSKRNIWQSVEYEGEFALHWDGIILMTNAISTITTIMCLSQHYFEDTHSFFHSHVQPSLWTIFWSAYTKWHESVLADVKLKCITSTVFELLEHRLGDKVNGWGIGSLCLGIRKIGEFARAFHFLHSPLLGSFQWKILFFFTSLKLKAETKFADLLSLVATTEQEQRLIK